MIILFNEGFHCLPKFVFKRSVIQQWYGSSSRSAYSPDFKLTGIKIVTKHMPGTTNRKHRKLIGVNTMSLFGYGIQFVLYCLESCQCFRI